MNAARRFAPLGENEGETHTGAHHGAPDVSPVTRAGVLGRMCHGWVFPLMRKGYSRGIAEGDLLLEPMELDMGAVCARFNAIWAVELASGRPRLGWTLVRARGQSRWCSGSLPHVLAVITARASKARVFARRWIAGMASYALSMTGSILGCVWCCRSFSVGPPPTRPRPRWIVSAGRSCCGR